MGVQCTIGIVFNQSLLWDKLWVGGEEAGLYRKRGGVEGLGGGRARKRFEKVVEEYEAVDTGFEEVGEDAEPVTDEYEAVAEEYEIVPTERLAEKLETDARILARLAENEAIYAECLVELRDRLRRLGELDDFRRREIERELRYVRARLYRYALEAKAIGACNTSPVLVELCERISRSGPPSYVGRIESGAENPAIILMLMRRYLPHCYERIAGR